MKLWQLTNKTPFAATARFGQDHAADIFWSVWIKATFRVDSDGRVLWAQDIPNELLDESKQQTEGSDAFVVEDSDIELLKAASDVTLVGDAVAPGSVADPYQVSLQVGSLRKVLEVQPARIWRRLRGVELFVPGCTRSVPLDWTQTFGGGETGDQGRRVFEENPIGIGFVPSGQRPDELHFPRVSYPSEELSRPGSLIRPGCFLPLPKDWYPRRLLAGTFDEHWRRHRAPVLPSDFSFEFRQAAPKDQRYQGFLQGGEDVQLSNTGWQGGPAMSGFRLPQLTFDVRVNLNGRWQQLQMMVQKLHIDARQGLLMLTWSSAVPIGAIANETKVGETVIVLTSANGFAINEGDAQHFVERERDADRVPA